MTPPLGSFEVLPAELRAKVYHHIFAGQLIHVCSSKKSGVYHLVGLPTIIDADSQRHAFDQECLACCESDYSSICRPGRWEQASCTVFTSLRPKDLLNFFLACRTFWIEAEPMLWEIACFCIGLPQFKSFYDRFLAGKRKQHPIQTPRGHLMRSLRLIVPDIHNLANRMGHDYNYHHLSPIMCILDAWESSSRTIASGMPNLTNVHVIVSPSNVTMDVNLDLPLSADVLNALLVLKGKLRRFDLDYVGLSGSPSPIVSLKAMSPQSIMRCRLEAVNLALSDMLTSSFLGAPEKCLEVKKGTAWRWNVVAERDTQGRDPEADMQELQQKAASYFENSEASK